MTDFSSDCATLAVVPVLVGPLQTLLALLPAIFLGLGSLLLAAFKPAGFKMLIRFCWRQKYFFACVAAIGFCFYHGFWLGDLRGHSHSSAVRAGLTTDWPAFRGGATRTGRGPGMADPTAPTRVWTNANDKTIYSSPAVSGERIIYSTVSGIGPFSPQGKGAIVCVDARSGDELWRYEPSDYRATFSSPVVKDGYVVCGEGLHLVQDARVTCLDLQGELVWQFPTKSHVESTACIAGGRVFIGAGDDGFYCLQLVPDKSAAAGSTNVIWHLTGQDFPDCESSPIVVDDVVYFGLGAGGHAVCAVDAATGKLRWKIDTPYPVFAPPTIAGGKLFVAMGNGNFVQSAADLLEMKLQNLRDDGATEAELAAARDRFGPAGEVWCIDSATHAVAWKFKARDTILGAIACRGDALYFGSRDGHLYHVSTAGKLVNRFHVHEPIVSSPALGERHLYFTAASGRLFGVELTTFKSVWDVSLGGGEGFISSPAVAHGHVFVGTPQDGLLCVGTARPPSPPQWTQGEHGGAADDEPVPKSLAIAWRFPPDKEEKFVVNAPLMPLDSSVYAAGRRGDVPELVKLDARPAAEISDRQVWSRRFERAIEVAPMGSGERLFVVESATMDGSQPATLHVLSARDGSEIWSRPLAAGSSAGMTLDTERVFICTNENTLTCLNAADASVLWRSMGGIRIGSPVVAENLVVASENNVLAAWDASSGAMLWRVKLTERPRGGPIIEGHHIRMPFENEVKLFYLVDGGFVKSEPLPLLSPVEHGEWREVAGVGQPVTPFVTMKGRVYVANAAGEVLCLAAEQP